MSLSLGVTSDRWRVDSDDVDLDDLVLAAAAAADTGGGGGGCRCVTVLS